MKTKFYYCPICGNVIIKMVDSGNMPSCCGSEMTELAVNTLEEKADTHLPIMSFFDSCRLRIKVGKDAHPMNIDHHIIFIYIETENGGQFVQLHPDRHPEVKIHLTECPKAIYAYCNKHGLWKTTIPPCPQHY